METQRFNHSIALQDAGLTYSTVLHDRLFKEYDWLTTAKIQSQQLFDLSRRILQGRHGYATNEQECSSYKLWTTGIVRAVGEFVEVESMEVRTKVA